MKTVMGCSRDDQWIKLPNLLEILTKSTLSTLIDYRYCDAKKTPEKVLKELISKNVRKPILIFAELITSDLELSIKKIAGKVNFEVVKSIETLRAIILDAGLIEDGIFLISIEFSRGIDIKLA